MAKYKHLTLEDRIKISNLLDKNFSFKEIARQLDKDCTSISKEIRKHLIFQKTGALGLGANCCINRKNCNYRKLCANCQSKRYCWTCKYCNSHCPDFKEEVCSKLDKPPYVCNGCDKLKSCTLEKRFYQASSADSEYKTILSESRQGISLSEPEIRHLDEFVSPLIKKGQSLNHICANNKSSLMISERTLYRLVDYNVFSARNIDLPRKVRYSKRKSSKNFKVDKSCRIGRNYNDFHSFMKLHPDLSPVEMDSVEGRKGGKVLLTIHFVKSEFMLAFLRDSNDAQSVIDIFEKLYLELRPDIFMDLFPVLLGDNGSEFSNPKAIEFDSQQNKRTNVFYCDAASPHQKGSAERNHEFIRYIIPKGTSLDGFNQDDITLMMNHINSYCRKSLGNKCPYDIFSYLHSNDDNELLKLLGCKKINPNDVILTPALFAYKNKETITL